jgi:hypothetical protein
MGGVWTPACGRTRAIVRVVVRVARHEAMSRVDRDVGAAAAAEEDSDALERLRAIRRAVREALGREDDAVDDAGDGANDEDYATVFKDLALDDDGVAETFGDDADDAACMARVRRACDADEDAAAMDDDEFDRLLARAAAEGEDVNAKNADGDDALHLAALYGRVNRARALLARGADALGRDENGGSALHDASASGHVEIVRALCESASASGKLKELISMVDDDGETPLHLAARGEHRDVVEYLLESGATKDARSLAGETPHDACEDADVRALLEI